MTEHKQKYDDFQKSYSEVHDYFKALLAGRTGTLNRPYSRYHGRKVIVNRDARNTWLYIGTFERPNNQLDISVNVGIERKDNQEGYIWDHAESHARLSEIIFDEPLP